jgi:hypothetical protein
VADGRVRAYLKTLDTATRLLTYASVDNPAVYAVAIAPDAAVTLNVLADGSATDRPATLAQLKDGLAKDGSENIPFWLTIKGGTITKIEEQFVP